MVKEKSEEDKNFSVSGVLKKLRLSRSGYYSYLRRTISKQKRRKQEIQKEIIRVHNESHQIYGAPKIAIILRRLGQRITEKTVGRYMRELKLKAAYIRPYQRTTLNSDFSSSLSNILKRDFVSEKPNTIWCIDITYIPTKMEGFVYLTSIMDLYSRRIISWTLSRNMKVEEVLKCLKEVTAKRKEEKPLIIQSDRGSQFVSYQYRQLTEGMKLSYSDKGCPWDNACLESFHSLIKREWLNRRNIVDYQDAYHLVFEYIEAFYNTVRIHSYNDYQSPKQREEASAN